jgi:hypothetical protein
VKPTRSPNSIETTRRSLTGSAVGAAVLATESPEETEVATGAAAGAASGVPHSLQNFPDDAGAPQDGQVAAWGVPHSAQNFAPGRFAAPQLRQVSSAIRALSSGIQRNGTKADVAAKRFMSRRVQAGLKV